MEQYINRVYINVKMKLTKLEYISNDLDMYRQDHKQHLKGFSHQSLFIKKLLTKNVSDFSYNAWKFETHMEQCRYRLCFAL